MAKRTRTPEPPPAKKGPKGAGNNPPFLKPEHINRDGNTRVKILDTIHVWQNDYGTSLWLHVMREDRKVFTLSVNCNYQDRISLQNVAGRNVIEWPGKVLELYMGKSQDGTKSYVNIFDPKRNAPDRAPKPANDDIPF
jgi:hypothetical protein